MAVQRISEELSQYIDAQANNKLTRLKSVLIHIFNCFEASNVFILKKGEIENYYLTDIGSQYSISDNKKTDYFLSECKRINESTQEKIWEEYPDIIELLDKLCPVTTIDTKSIASHRLGDWIHYVQTAFQTSGLITKEDIETHPKVQWNKFKRIIDLVEFLPDTENHTFICKFKIGTNLIENRSEIYEFNQDTVPSRFTL